MDKVKLKETLGLVLAIAGVSSLVASGLIALFSFYTEISTIPDRLTNLERLVETQISGQPQILDFLGTGVVHSDEVSPGDVVNILYVLRRNVSCDTIIRVRWWNFETNNFEPGPVQEIPAIHSPVSSTFTPFSVPVRIPDWLPDGDYGYLPEIVPMNCGVYGTIVSPISDVIHVRR